MCKYQSTNHFDHHPNPPITSLVSSKGRPSTHVERLSRRVLMDFSLGEICPPCHVLGTGKTEASIHLEHVVLLSDTIGK